MTRSEKLDTILANLAEHNLEYNEVYKFYFNEEINQELKILLGQIVKDGLATVKEINDPEKHEAWGYKVEVYRITTEGLQFKETSSYQEKHIKEQQGKFWSLGKKIAVVINGILLLFATLAGVYISNKANEDNLENKRLKHTIDSLNYIIRTQVYKKDTVYIMFEDQLKVHHNNQ